MTKELIADPDTRILKTGTCPTLSGKAKLTYQIGLKAESELLVRITKNSGGGFFSTEWVPLARIQKTLLAKASESGVTSFTFRPLFKGKSVNSGGFLLAALKQEGAVTVHPEKTRLHQLAKVDDFLAGLAGLAQGGAGGGESGGAKKAAPAKKAPRPTPKAAAKKGT